MSGKRHNNATTMSELPENLTPVRAAHVFEEGRLAGYMKANVEGYRGPIRVLQFEGGQSNPTFHLTDGAGRFAHRQHHVANLARFPAIVVAGACAPAFQFAADLLVLDASPLTDINNLSKLRYVIQNGVVRDAETLDEVWPVARRFRLFPWRSEDEAFEAMRKK